MALALVLSLANVVAWSIWVRVAVRSSEPWFAAFFGVLVGMSLVNAMWVVMAP